MIMTNRLTNQPLQARDSPEIIGGDTASPTSIHSKKEI